MNLSVIVAKIEPASEQDVAAIWEESDLTELPRLAGVLHRSLYRLGDLYVHLLETEQPGASAVEAVRRHPEFNLVSERLSSYITPYLSTWRSPRDAQAHRFYEWAPRSAAPEQLRGAR